VYLIQEFKSANSLIDYTNLCLNFSDLNLCFNFPDLNLCFDFPYLNHCFNFHICNFPNLNSLFISVCPLSTSVSCCIISVFKGCCIVIKKKMKKNKEISKIAI